MTYLGLGIMQISESHPLVYWKDTEAPGFKSFTQRLPHSFARAAIIEHHGLGGSNNRNLSQFWRLQVQNQGVGKFGFF